jgi:alginate O-acetyltransferase complex protein AlgI
MAIGLARMFGFRFPENFNYPYTANSIQDFWRRWHISLSTWFRDYVYIPLGGNRIGRARTMFNLWVVFLLTGIWHGASWNFLIWGAIHGFFLMTERLVADSTMARLRVPVLLQHLYTMVVVMLAWVFFRIEGSAQALQFVGLLMGQTTTHATGPTYDSEKGMHMILLFSVALLLASGVYATVANRWAPYFKNAAVDGLLRTVIALPLLTLSMMMLALGQYNPFIYFRF